MYVVYSGIIYLEENFIDLQFQWQSSIATVDVFYRVDGFFTAS